MRTVISPKDDFLKDPNRAGAHQDRVVHPEFKAAAQVAMLEYQYQLPMENLAAASALKLKGAQEFLAILLNLGEAKEPMSAPKSDQLIPT